MSKDINTKTEVVDMSEIANSQNVNKHNIEKKIEDSKQNSLKKLNKKKRKKIIKIVIIVLVCLALLLLDAYKSGLFDKLLGKEDLSQNTVTTYSLTEDTAYRTITKVLTSSGTIEPNDQYTITALVSGEILSDHFNKGDTVIEDQLLYEIESDSLDSNVTRARNNLKTAQTNLDEAYEKLEKLNIDTEYTGIIQKIHVEVGDEVNAGQLIAEITDSETMVLTIPFLDSDCDVFMVGSLAEVSFIDSPEVITGTVKEISPVTKINSIGAITREVEISVKNPGSIIPGTFGLAKIQNAVCTDTGSFSYNDEGSVNAEISGEVTNIYFSEGSHVTKGSIIVKLESTSLQNQIESLEISVNNAQTSLDDALDAYDNYNITSPISGTVISKEYKAGDTIGGGNNNSQLAVIYDMSALKFTMSIDELDIDSLEEGQQVVITSDSRVGSQYYGTVTNISIQGTTTNGTTVYPVEVTIENVEDESQRRVLDDGSVSKVYKTGMTSTESTYSLTEHTAADGAYVYTYSDGTIIKRVDYDGGYSLYIGDDRLNNYTEASYILASTVYSFSDDFSKMTVEVRNEKKMLRPGMNIDAEIIVEKRENIIAVPVNAVSRGNIVKVLKNPEDASSEQQHMPENMPHSEDGFSKRAANPYGTANKNSEYEEVRVTVGISDEEYIEITSGLEIGDVIIVESAERTYSGYGMFGMMGMGGGMPNGGMPSGGMPSGSMPSGGRQMGGGMPR